MSEMKHFGNHYLIEYVDCKSEKIGSSRFVENSLLEAVEYSDATYISHHSHQFSPTGVSAVVVIAESHFSVHSWPEDNYVAFDIFTCGDKMRPERAIKYLKRCFEAADIKVMKVRRGFRQISACDTPDVITSH